MAPLPPPRTADPATRAGAAGDVTQGAGRNALLHAAMQVYWRHGLGGATLSRLCRATGLPPRRLYEVFGSRAGLYAETLAHCMKQLPASATEALDAPGDAADVVLRVLVDAVDRAMAGIDTAPAATDTADPLVPTATLALYRARFDRVQREHGLPDGIEPGPMAQYLGALVEGLQARARDGAKRDTLREAAAAAALSLRR